MARRIPVDEESSRAHIGGMKSTVETIKKVEEDGVVVEIFKTAGDYRVRMYGVDEDGALIDLVGPVYIFPTLEAAQAKFDSMVSR